MTSAGGKDPFVLSNPHANDSLEHNNTAASPEFTTVKASLQKWLPQHDEPGYLDSKGKGKDD